MGAHRFNPQARNNLLGQLPLVVKDQHGRALVPGDTVVIPSLALPQFRIGDIKPNLHPGAPPNTAQVLVQFQAIFAVALGQNVQEFLLCRTAEEVGVVQPGGPVEDSTAGVVVPEEAPAPALDGPKLVTE